MNLELLEYFSLAYMVPGTNMEEVEEVYKQFRRLTFEERQAFKQEVLYVKELLDTNNHQEIKRVCEAYLSDSSLTHPPNLVMFISLIIPIIEKYEYDSTRGYKQLEVFEYVLHTYFLSNVTWDQFIYEDIQREDDTLLAHLKKDIELIEEAFDKQDTALLNELTQISEAAGMYILRTEHRETFLDYLKAIS